MSEKELRGFLDEMWSLVCESGECRCGGCGYHRKDCEIGQALSADPDVVAVLRWLEDARKTALDSQYMYHELSDYQSAGEKCVEQDTFETVRVAIEEQFHVRLTDDSWEWI